MKNKTGLFVLVMLLVITVVVMGVSTVSYKGKGQAEGKSEILLVTSFYPVYTMALNLTEGIEGITVKNLSTPQTGCLHDYEPTTEDMRLLSEADIFLMNGGGMESFMADFYDELPDLAFVECFKGVEGEEDNPHYWMDPVLYSEAVTSTAERLSDNINEKLGRDVHDQLTDNAAKYRAKLESLISDSEEIAAKAGEAGIKAVDLQEGFYYTASSLGLEVIGDIDLDEERTSSAGEVAEVVDAISEAESENVLIFSDEIYGAKTAVTISETTGARVVYLDTMVFPEEGENPADVYVLRMQSNLDAIAKALP